MLATEPLTFEEGVRLMVPEPEFVVAPEKRLVALSGEFSLETRNEIPGLWKDFWSREWKLPGDEGEACYGASYSARPDGRFAYAAGLSVEPIPDELPEGARVVTLSAGALCGVSQEGTRAGDPGAIRCDIFLVVTGLGRKAARGGRVRAIPIRRRRVARIDDLRDLGAGRGLSPG